jgi:hypothetical protein
MLLLMTTKPPKTKDHSAVKFDVAEALGEWMNCLYLKGTKDGFQEYDFIHHRDADGVSAITLLMEKEGHKVLSQPGLRIDNRPSLSKRLKALKKYISLTKKVPIRWKNERIDRTGIPKTYAMIVLSKEETKAIHEKAKELNISSNSLLLWALDKAVFKELLESDSARKWVAPLNMRPSENKDQLIRGNYSASIITNLFDRPEDSPNFIHQSIKNYLKDNIHWGSFIYSNMARFIGFKGTLKVARNIKEVGTGVFSNLGIWPNEGIQINKNAKSYDWRAVLAPTTQILPVAATSWQWGENMSLTLQLHPSLNVPEETCQRLLQNWSKNLLIPIETSVTMHNWQDYPECPQELF